MTLLKIFLPLILVPAALAKYKASLICELEDYIRTETRNGYVTACYSGTTGNCGFENIVRDDYYIGGHWTGHDYTLVTNVYCEGGTGDSDVGLCYYSGGNYWNTGDHCDTAGFGEEAVVTVVADSQRRRLGEPKFNFEGKLTKEVDIEGKKWVLLNPDFHEED